jgi:hypothetical protein
MKALVLHLPIFKDDEQDPTPSIHQAKIGKLAVYFALLE